MGDEFAFVVKDRAPAFRFPESICPADQPAASLHRWSVAECLCGDILFVRSNELHMCYAGSIPKSVGDETLARLVAIHGVGA